MVTKNYVSEYFINEIIKIGEAMNYKYVLLWAEKYYEKLIDKFDLISIELIKKEMPKYYANMIKRRATNLC